MLYNFELLWINRVKSYIPVIYFNIWVLEKSMSLIYLYAMCTFRFELKEKIFLQHVIFSIDQTIKSIEFDALVHYLLI